MVARVVDPRPEPDQVVRLQVGLLPFAKPDQVRTARVGHGLGDPLRISVVERFVDDHSPHAHHQTGT